MKIIKNTMTAREYHDISRRFKVDAMRYPYVMAVKKHTGNGYRVTNARIAETLDMTKMGASKTLRQLEKDGIIANVSDLGNRKDWMLTKTGEELLEIIKAHLTIREG